MAIYRLPALGALLCAAIFLTNCGSSVSLQTQSQQSETTTSSSSGVIQEQGGPAQLKLIPVAIESTPAESGWVHYKVSAAIENPGPQYVALGTVYDSGTIETKEGFTYQIAISDFQGGAQILLPPTFRIMGAYFSFKAAQDAHPIKARFNKFGELDLTQIQQVTFPTAVPYPALKPLSAGLSANNAKISFANMQSEQDQTTLDVTMVNLDKGYDNADAIPICAAVDNTGEVHSFKSELVYQLGPGQTVQATFYLDGYTPKEVLPGAVLICENNFKYPSGEGSIDVFSLSP